MAQQISFDIDESVRRAANRLGQHVRQTPVDYSYHLSQLGDCHVFLKLENLQYTGSFKVRGAMNKLLSLQAGERSRSVVTASTGNHGAAIAYGTRKLGRQGIVFVPRNASQAKVDNVRRLGAEIRVHGDDSAETESFARRYAEQNEMIYISPYNDLQVIAGQGTIAEELVRQVDEIDAIFVPLGGGGMISGIAGFLKSVMQEVQVFGCSPEHSPVMIESLKAGRIIEMTSRPTLSDGTAGGVEAGAITFDFCRRWVDDCVTVSEREIKEAMLMFLEKEHQLIEGAAGCAVAAFLKKANDLRGKNVVIVVSGANVSLETLRTVVC